MSSSDVSPKRTTQQLKRARADSSHDTQNIIQSHKIIAMSTSAPSAVKTSSNGPRDHQLSAFDIASTSTGYIDSLGRSLPVRSRRCLFEHQPPLPIHRQDSNPFGSRPRNSLSMCKVGSKEHTGVYFGFQLARHQHYTTLTRVGKRSKSGVG